MNNIIFLGDSITDAFHNMDGANSLGRGYVRRIADRLYDDGYKGEIRNAGHDGFTAAGVLRMMEYDCLRHQPDLVSVLVGCNDAGICMNTGKTLKEQGFQQNYEELLKSVMAAKYPRWETPRTSSSSQEALTMSARLYMEEVLCALFISSMSNSFFII